MARLTAEEQKEYEEEVEYQQEHQPTSTRYRKPSAMERIKEAVKGGPTGKAIRSFAERVNASEGLGGGGGFQAPSIMQNSSMNPKKKIYKNERQHAPRTVRDMFGEDRGL